MRAAVTSPPMLGKTLGHYRVLEKIGAGGMGEVYRATDTHLGRDVALKVLPAGLLADEAARKRFRKEAEALSKLNHPHIATVHDFDTQGGVDFLVMEHIAGLTLAERLTSGPLPESELARLGAEMAAALEEAHEHGVVHRDLKPGNIKLTPKGHVKVLDFGLAKLLQPCGATATTESLTDMQTVAGTLPYMAPEQLRGEGVDHRSDLWAAGAVLYEMATGRRPFEAKLATALAADIQHQPVAPPSQLNPKLSLRLEGVIVKCLEKEPADRYQSAKELLVDLRRLSLPPPARTAELPASVRRARRAARPRIRSLAVLPLENLSRDPDQEYFADGMTEALITDLAKIGGLKVISRTSVMRYRAADKPLPVIARELNVDGVVEGSVLRAGSRVRITAQLIHAATDEHLWAESYQREVSDILELQSEVARTIAQEIKVKLTPQERARLAGARRVNPEAHDALLKARYYWSKWDLEGFRKSIEYFHQAIERDPTYAQAYAGLAQAFVFLGYWGYAPTEEAYPKAKAAALKALELDDTLGDAYLALGVVNWFYDWDICAAEKGLRRALELSPNDALAHLWHAVFLGVIREEHDPAIAGARKAQELDPLSLLVHSTSGWVLWWARKYDQAAAQARKVLEMDSTFLQAYYVLGNVLASQLRFEEAIAVFQKAVELSGAALALAWLGMAYGLAGQADKARAIVNELELRSKKEHVPKGYMAWIHMGLGENDKVFELLELFYQARDSYLFWLKVGPAYDPLRSDPRFQDLLRRMNFPP